MSGKTYVENFDDGPGGWYKIIDNMKGMCRLPVKNGIIHSYGPWWVDYNHAPPGAGYLHLLMGLHIKYPVSEANREMGGPNHYIEGNYPTNLTDAKFTIRLKGELELQGSQICLLIQANHEGLNSGWILTGQPIEVTKDWSDQTFTAVYDPEQWTAMGSRHDRTDTYGVVDLKKVLGDVNCNIYMVLFPLNVVPKGPIEGDPHILRAGYDYPNWLSKLPDGYVMVDTITIEFP